MTRKPARCQGNMISIVAALDERRGIGKNNDLLFKIPQDFARMKALTNGHPIIMGSRTFKSIGRILPNRTNIIITRDKNFRLDGAVVVHSLDEAIEVAKRSPGSEEIIIFGGGQVFKEAIARDLVDVLHLTIVKGDYGADVFFPEYKDKFTKVLSEQKGKSGDYEYKFIDLAR